jgi:hypothetical protein
VLDAHLPQPAVESNAEAHATAVLAVATFIPLMLCGLGCVWRKKRGSKVVSGTDLNFDGGHPLATAAEAETAADSVWANAIAGAMDALKVISLRDASEALEQDAQEDGVYYDDDDDGLNDAVPDDGISGNGAASDAFGITVDDSRVCDDENRTEGSDDDGDADYADTEETGDPIEQEDRYARIKAGYTHWRKDAAVKAELKEAFQRLHPPETIRAPEASQASRLESIKPSPIKFSESIGRQTLLMHSVLKCLCGRAGQ